MTSVDFFLPALLAFQVIALQPGMCAGSSWTPQLLSAKSPLGSPCHIHASLLKQQLSSNPVIQKKKFRGPSIRHSILLPKRKTLPVLHISFWSSSSLCRWVTRAYCFRVPPKQFDFSFGFFTREKYSQGLQCSWHPSALTKRPFFSSGPYQHSSAFNSLFLCQDSLQEWGLYEDIIAWERNVIKSNI